MAIRALLASIPSIGSNRSPIRETRNYVQRVIENMEVYRNRLAGGSEPLRILADLYRPNPPPHLASLGPAPAVPASIPVRETRPGHANAAAPRPTETAELEHRLEPAKPVRKPSVAPSDPVTIPTPRPSRIAVPKQRPER